MFVLVVEFCFDDRLPSIWFIWSLRFEGIEFLVDRRESLGETESSATEAAFPSTEGATP